MNLNVGAYFRRRLHRFVAVYYLFVLGRGGGERRRSAKLVVAVCRDVVVVFWMGGCMYVRVFFLLADAPPKVYAYGRLLHESAVVLHAAVHLFPFGGVLDRETKIPSLSRLCTSFFVRREK